MLGRSTAALLLPLLLLATCSPWARPVPTPTPEPVHTVGVQPVILIGVGDSPAVVQFVDQLAQQAIRAEPDGPSMMGFELAPGQVYRLYRGSEYLGPIHVYLFVDDAAAKSAAATIPTGVELGRQSEWGDYPHFFLCKELIVLFIGHDQATVDALAAQCGPAFADFGN